MSWALALGLEAPWEAERAFKEREKVREGEGCHTAGEHMISAKFLNFLTI